MRNSSWTIATTALLAVLGFTSPALLADGDGGHHAKFKLALAGDDAAEFELEELAVGESRHLTTEQGKPVTVTRTEAGYEIDIDGKKIQVGFPGAEAGHFGLLSGGGKKVVVRSGQIERRDGEAGAEVMVRALGADGEEIELGQLVGGAGKQIVIHRAGGEDQVIELGDDAPGRVIVVKKRVDGCAGEQENCVQVEVRVEKRAASEEEEEN